MILVEVRELSPRVTFRSTNSDSIREEIDLSNEAREIAHIREKALKQRVTKRYNSIVVPRKFEEGDMVLRRANIEPPAPDQGKLAVNWEGPYKIIEVLGKMAYKLSTLSRSEVPRLWNSSNLRKFYV